ncbi:MAG: hypothetical protein M3R25_10850, partial [Bacteroidota bacterium]|nr:hypothetical protein [Bacteroidota bacterium]
MFIYQAGLAHERIPINKVNWVTDFTLPGSMSNWVAPDADLNDPGSSDDINEDNICPPDITTGLIAYYPFTGNAEDNAGTLDGTPTNGASLTEGRSCESNTAYSFDGSDDFINFSGPAITQTDNFTMSAWVNPATLTQD